MANYITKSCLVLVFLSVFSFTSFVAPTYLYYFCSNVTIFNRNSIFIANIKDLFFHLSSNVTVHDGFYNSTAGQHPNIVYGLFLCRGDVPPEICQDCVHQAVDDVAGLCPNQTGAIIWYNECMLRYSNVSIFSSMEEKPNVRVWYNVDATEPERFNRLVATSMKDIVPLASNSTLDAKKFATKEAKYTEFQTVYSLAQCTPYISDEDCYKCLEKAVADFPKCCSGKTSAYALYPSCIAQFQVAPFYNKNNQTKAAPPLQVSPPPLLHPPPPTGCKASRKLIALTNRDDGSKARAMQSLRFDLSIIEAATSNFSEAKKIGAGGFGSVYKGTLPNGEEIAVKRLSTCSGQGAGQFQTEVLVLAKLQHRNLVKLFGYCQGKGEMMLIYEFVPNKSLDYFIFDPEKQRQLDWPKRYKIIKGIARGLLYLHTDSRIKVIHRDLKASNILLDEHMTPKISDFGMSKVVGQNKSLEHTMRVVGTYGYMSPEYAVNGRFSEKSDVFSFGILILEIVCGKMNTSFCHSEFAYNLITYAWKCWKNGAAIELVDSTLQDSYVSNEVLRCIQIGLLCVQENPGARPTMARVVMMLSSSSVTLPLPQKIAFYFGTITGQKLLSTVEHISDQSTCTTSSSATVNEASLTELYPR